MSQTTLDPLTAALEHHRAGRWALAEQLYRQLLLREPSNADAWHLLGALCLQLGRASEAVDLIGRAIEIRSDNPDFYNHLGAAYGALAQHDQAVASLRRAVQIAPQSDVTHYNLGTALRNQDKLEEAAASFLNAVAINPNSAEARYNLGNTLRELKRSAEAEASYRAALRARPNYVKAMLNLGNVLRDARRYGEAIEILRRAVEIEPQYATGHLNLGTALRDAGQYSEAVECLRRAVALQPDMAKAYNNLGTALQSQARFPEALECYEESLRLDPELADAHFSRATYRLRQGDIEAGFAEYEWRWKCSAFNARALGVPRWDGGPLAGRTILLHAEQGFGDTLQFIRYAIDVKERGGVVVVECQRPLLKILANCPGVDRLVAVGETLPAVDGECPLLSLPGVLKLGVDQLFREPYLAADAVLVALWRETLAPVAGFRIGICWQGNPIYTFDRQRSFPLSRLEPLAAVDGVRLVSLQRGPGSEQITGSPFEVIDLGPQLDETAGSFMDTAAVMKNLDLVVTSDTAIAHLAGGLGVPVWVALPAHCDWRWFLSGDTTPWYPSMRLFRQSESDVWDGVFERMAAAVGGLVSSRA